jgi:hypothetical protein
MVKLEEGETALYFARKHWCLFVSETAFLVLFALLPGVVLFIPSEMIDEALDLIRFTGGFPSLFLFLWSLWLMLLWVFFALLWTDYYLDMWVITNHRVIDIEQLGLFYRKVSSFRYNQIQDATVKVPGLLATLIGFGTVELRTASNETFRFKGVAHPTALKERIMSEHHRVHADNT